MRRLLILGCALLAAPALLAPAGAMAERGPERAELAVPGGHLALAGGRVRGWFVVRNQGEAPTGAIGAKLWVGSRSQHFRIGALAPGAGRKVLVSTAAPAASAAARVCVSVASAPGIGLCRGLGTVAAGPASGADGASQGGAGSGGSQGNGGNGAPPGAGNGGSPGGGNGGSPGGGATPPGSGGGDQPTPTSSVPTDPIAFQKGTVFSLQDPSSNYWAYVPPSYDSTHRTPMTLFVWLHGCGGESAWDIRNVSPGGGQDWISIAVGGEEGGCWDPGSDGAKVLAAIADLKTHFDVAPKRVILGGYSSGGDLAYRLAFEHASQFAGILVENTTPFRDTGLSRSQALAAASWKFHVVQLAHLQDTTYPTGTVREETAAMTAAGFPLELVERRGTHYDEPGARVGGEKVPGTEADVRTYLLPHIDDGWTAP